MTDSKLIIHEYGRRDLYHIAWFFEDDGDLGASLGDAIYTPEDLHNAAPENRDHIAATLAVVPFMHERDPAWGYVFYSRAQAKKALAAAKAAIKIAASNVPYPDWAKTAIAAGWKPPRGWKP